jgi:4-hydroxybenzoate polyprenyltransferase
MTTLSAPAAPPLVQRLQLVAADIKLAHSVFALPFAILAAFLARDAARQGWRLFAAQLALVVICMVLARTWAMLVNRLADRCLDAANPRTARRIFAAGRLTPAQGWTVALSAATFFIIATAGFWVLDANPWPLMLSIPVLAWIAFYSLTKRFTALCHLFLGGALAASPLAAAIAVNPSALAVQPALWWIAAMVLVWVAGFDIIYALQDLDFDRRSGLASIPARFGATGALWISRLLHALAVLFLVLAWQSDPRLSALFAAGIAAVAALLITEHAILLIRGRAGLNMAFFTINGIVSCALGAAGVLDVVF